LARDRLGIKPVYFRETDKSFYFSSHMAPLISVEGKTGKLDFESLHFYMTLHSIVPAPRTLVKDVKKLEPAHYIKVIGGRIVEKQRYWSVSDSELLDFPQMSDTDWKDRILSILRKSVERRLVADVPVGVFLSGGLDSSLVTALIREQNPGDLKTFSIGFRGINKEDGNEFKYSRIIAEKYATDHHEISVSTQELLEHLPEALRVHSEPMVSHDNVGFYLLSRFSSEMAKVVQSGQGADEVFAGYHWYPTLKESKNVVSDYCKLFFDYPYEELTKHTRKEFFKQNYCLDFVESYFGDFNKSTPLWKAMHLDTHVMLVEDPVKRVDNNTMAWGLEARVPFLDHELVEAASHLPDRLKLAHEGKGILKSIGYDLLPHEVIDRPKGYFPVTELKYIQGPFLEFVKNLIDPSDAKIRSLFKGSHINTLLGDPPAHMTPLRGSKLWQIAVLENWLQNHKVEVQ
ncbi:MAG: N-acetylglutaminylglutamine amidotransferase, partial [Bdellovibrionales bacterium]|nr:N-acetylglutaminylglutamine amidotransferase [Bdellovibrionales bacterium]